MSNNEIEPGLFRKGLVVVPREIQYSKLKRAGKKPPAVAGFTLHIEECRHAKRSTRPQPAPAEPYPGTVACRYCKPSLTVEKSASNPEEGGTDAS